MRLLSFALSCHTSVRSLSTLEKDCLHALERLHDKMRLKPTIAFHHLGCEKNRVDTEHMLGLLVQAGYQVDANEELADYVVVNTCSFIEAAREESVRTLVELAEAE
jgi:hypothetical protein